MWAEAGGSRSMFPDQFGDEMEVSTGNNVSERLTHHELKEGGWIPEQIDSKLDPLARTLEPAHCP